MKKRAFTAAAALSAALSVTAEAQSAQAAGPMHQPVLLGGKPFPRVQRHVPELPTARRTFYVAPGKEGGDGSEKNPWTDLQQALRALEPGDRLRVAKGTYPGGLAIDGRCRDGTRDRPIQLAFDRNAVILPAGGSAAMTIRRSHWHISGPLLRLGDSASGGIAIESSSVSLDAVQISGGAGAGVRIGRGASGVTLSNCIISRRTLTRPSAASVGVEIEAGAAEIVVTNNRFLLNRSGSIRVGAGPASARPPRNIRLSGNTIRDDGATAIHVERAAGLRILDNAFFSAIGAAETRGLDLREVDGAVVRSNQITGFAVAVSIGRVDPVVYAPRDVLIDHNHLETGTAGGIGLSIEAGSAIRFANNVVNGYADAILLLGRRPSLSEVTVANNLVLAVSRTAFAIRDRAAAVVFDFNVFSPRGNAVEVEVNGAPSTLASFLERGTMPNSKLARVTMFDHDLARLGGIETVDRGTAVGGVAFDGKAPDLGVAER